MAFLAEKKSGKARYLSRGLDWATLSTCHRKKTVEKVLELKISPAGRLHGNRNRDTPGPAEPGVDDVAQN